MRVMFLRLRKWILLYLSQLKFFTLQNFVTVKGRRFEMCTSESRRITQPQKMRSARQRIYEKDRQCTYRHSIEARSRNHSCRRKAISITCSECLSLWPWLSSKQNACAVLQSSVAVPVVPCFYTLSRKMHEFLK